MAGKDHAVSPEPPRADGDPNSPAVTASVGAGKHTPGPWRLHKMRRTIVASGPVGPSHTGVCDCASLYNAPDDATAAANARLIAAAPDMLEALQRIANAPAWGAPDRWEATPSEVRQLARAAAAKATGQ